MGERAEGKHGWGVVMWDGGDDRGAMLGQCPPTVGGCPLLTDINGGKGTGGGGDATDADIPVYGGDRRHREGNDGTTEGLSPQEVLSPPLPATSFEKECECVGLRGNLFRINRLEESDRKQNAEGSNQEATMVGGNQQPKGSVHVTPGGGMALPF